MPLSTAPGTRGPQVAAATIKCRMLEGLDRAGYRRRSCRRRRATISCSATRGQTPDPTAQQLVENGIMALAFAERGVTGA